MFLFAFFMIFHGSLWVYTGEGEIAVVLVILIFSECLDLLGTNLSLLLTDRDCHDYRVIDVKRKLFVTDDVDVMDLWKVQD
jgi:hypothetical protein